MSIWIRALKPSNFTTANKIAKFMRENWGWQVTVMHGRLHQIQAGRKYWQYCTSIGNDPKAQAERMALELGMGAGHINLLNMHLIDDDSVGRYTILPFPKDITQQSPAPASHFQ